MRTPIVAGNWKMNKHVDEARHLAGGVAEAVAGLDDVEVVVSPTAISLVPVAEAVEGSTVGLAAQTMHWAESGAYTGEVSPTMLRDVGCDWVILGHSERRQFFGETDQQINHKTHAALDHHLRPMICVGETLEERQQDRITQKIECQVRAALAGIDPADLDDLVIAYEPIWAIGTGQTATPEQAQEVHSRIRAMVADVYSPSRADHLRILYGGSVKPHNIDQLIGQPDIDGPLVGGASLQIDSFAAIAQTVNDHT